MKNWKSVMAWTMFSVGYNFALYTNKAEPIVYTTGMFAILMSVAMMFRSEFTTELIGKLIDNMKVGK